MSHFLGPIFSSFFFKKVIFSHWFRSRTNARWFRRQIRVLKQSFLAKILDHHLHTQWARLWSFAPSGQVCKFWLGKPRKLLLTTFFIVFSVKKKLFYVTKLVSSLQRKIETGKNFHYELFFSKFFFQKGLSFQLEKCF